MIGFLRMKTICLVRHAKSSWDYPELDDFDRPLNSRGRHDAPFMARQLLERTIVPELVVSSPANRAAATARTIAAQLHYPLERVRYEAELYDAGVEDLLGVIGRIDAAVGTLLLVGHNPGLTALADRLLGAPLGNIPTAGVCGLALDIPTWEGAGRQRAGLLFFDFPKKPRP